MLELYHHGASVCAAKVRLALSEKGVAWQGRYVDILAGEQFAPDFLKLSPSALVPVLLHDGHAIRESTVINEYVDEAFEGPALSPASPLARAEMRLWTKLVDEQLHPAVAPLTFALSHRYVILEMPDDERCAYIDATPDPTQRERKRLWVENGLDAPDVGPSLRAFARAYAQMEVALSRGDWLAGNAYSLADTGLTPYVNRIEMLGIAEAWQERYPRVDRWFRQIKARPSFEPEVLNYISLGMRDTMRRNGRQSADRLAAMLS
jgi:glutathione S-transferase